MVNVKCFIRQEHAFIIIPAYERDVHTLLDSMLLHVCVCRPKRHAFYAQQRVFYDIKKKNKKKLLTDFDGHDDWIAVFLRMRRTYRKFWNIVRGVSLS